MPRRYTTHVDENGRVCTVCNIYKSRDNYSYGGIQRTGRLSRCKDCFNAYVSGKLSDLDTKVKQNAINRIKRIKEKEMKKLS